VGDFIGELVGLSVGARVGGRDALIGDVEGAFHGDRGAGTVNKDGVP
jgi:hypothetical protein